MPSIDYRRLCELVGMADVLRLIGFVPRSQRGNQLRGTCPYHEGNSQSKSASSPTFSVNLVTNTFRCFKCGAEGNQLDLWSIVTKQSLYESAHDLCNRFHIDIPHVAKKQRTEKRNP